jgi:hypothetical protein
MAISGLRAGKFRDPAAARNGFDRERRSGSLPRFSIL